MRIDLSAAFIAAKNSATRRPRQLLVFHFPGAGEVRLSDQPLGAADGLSAEYGALVEDWGELLDMAGGDPTDYTAGEIRQASIVLWNGGARPFSDYFLSEDPENVTVDLYQWFVGLADSDKALIDTFAVQDPIAFDEVSRLLRLDLVSLSMRHDNPLGELLTKANWPNAEPTDIGKGIPIWLGTPGEVPTLYARTAPAATLNGSILDTTTTISVNEDLAEQGFAASGSIQIGEELIRYSSRTTSSFAVLQRGYLSAAAEHLDRDKIVQKIEDHTFLVGKGPISAINSVKVGGFAAPAEIYAAYPALDPARIVFTEKPYSYRFADASSFLEMQFDLTNGDNTALQAYQAYDAADQATAATISPLYPLLSIQQTTTNPDRGEIVKAYLAVEHWESDRFLSDYVDVWVEGIGVVGNLSRPNQADAVDVVADVDLDHGHTKSITGEHTHTFTNPALATATGSHAHGSTQETLIWRFDSIPVVSNVNYSGNAIDGNLTTLASLSSLYSSGYFTTARAQYEGHSGAPQQWRACVSAFDFDHNGGTALTFAIGGVSVSAQDSIVKSDWQTTNLSWDLINALTGRVDFSGGSSASHCIEVWLEIRWTPEITANAATGVSASIASSGSSAVKSANDISVNDLATANEPLQNVEAEAATRTIVNLFDITAQVNFDWAWFTGRDVKLTYRGTVDAKEVYIVHCFFDVEYRKRDRVFSDEVTCEPVGLIDDGTGTYTGTPGAVITRPDHVRKYLLCGSGGMPTAYIDTASFAAAGSSFASLGYAFNGMIDASTTVRDAEKKLAWQCRSRFFWSAGTAKIALRRKLIDTTGCKQLAAADYRLKSISAQRQRVSDLINSITLFYSRQWTSADAGTAGFTASVAGLNNSSISQHGTLENRDLFTFDLVTNETMANDLLAFYLENLAYPSTFYTFDTYLNQFELEKEDCISLTSTFNRLRKANMVIRAADRAFGSGKLRRINYIRIVAESLRYILLDQTINETVSVFDSLTVTIGLPGFFNDSVYLSDDQIFAMIVIGAVETITVAEALQVVFLINYEIGETATAGDELACHLFATLADSFSIIDELATPTLSVGFGSGGFGQSNFGGTLVSVVGQLDETMLSEVLSAAVNAALSDTATATDGTILFGGGFGGNSISDGFGVSPFGR